MLKEMYVKNFILIDEMHISFDEKMSAFTGETGAGKSLLMDAIGILKGDRINVSMIKEGQDKAIIEGVFEVKQRHIAYAMLRDAGYEIEDGIFSASREFSRAGKSIARINQRVVNVSFLRDVISSLIDIHSQHDTQYLLNAKYHLQLLDNFCNHREMLEDVKTTYHQYKHIHDELEAALHEDYNEDDLEFLTFQLNEIDEADLKDDELEQLEDQQKRLMAFEKITQRVHKSISMLEDEGGGNALIYEAYKEVDAIHEDTFFEQIAERLQEAYYMVDEQLIAMKDHMDGFEYDEATLHTLQERIFLLHKILRKYGPSYQDVINKRSEIEHKIDIILHRQDFVDKQETACKEALEHYLVYAQALHEQRVIKAKELESCILVQLKDLQLLNARFHVQIDTFDGNASGIDRISFLISMNQGEPLKPLNTTASGGELSRFMLGLKSVFTSLQGIETIVFDEIDTGVSGLVAYHVGRKMKEIAQDVQVFCVTHLASVAACAKHHFIVEKEQDHQSTSTRIRKLDESQRIKELAMISNNSTSDSALEAAKELYERAQGE